MSMQPTPPQYGISGYSARRPRLILIGLIGLCGLFVYGYSGRLAELDEVKAKIVTKQAMVDTAIQKNAKYVHLYDEVRRDTYIDEVARPWLDLVLPGDIATTIVKTEPMANADALASTDTLTPPPDLRRLAPVWQQWVDFFTAGATPLY